MSRGPPEPGSPTWPAAWPTRTSSTRIVGDWTARPGARRRRGRPCGRRACRPRRPAPDERIDHDPRQRAWGLWPTAVHSEMGQVRVDGLPVHLSAGDWEIERGARARRAQRRGLRRAARARARGDRPAGRGGGHLMGGPLARAPGRGAGQRARRLRRQAAGRPGCRRHPGRAPRGDPAQRLWAVFDDEPGPERSLWWWHYQTSKRSVVLDLDDAGTALRSAWSAGPTSCSRRAARPAGASSVWAATSCRRAAPAWSWCRSPRSGRTPRSAEPVTDLTIMAGGGPVWSCGYDDHDLPPVRGGGQPGLPDRPATGR